MMVSNPKLKLKYLHSYAETEYGIKIARRTVGLKRAVSEEIPRAEHRNCARHVFANWIGRTLDRSYEQAYWGIVKAGTEEECQAKVDSLIAKNDTVGKELMQDDKNPRAWSRAFYGEHAKCDMVDNNICESFNSILLEARTKSIITMLEQIREETQKRIEAKRIFCSKWKHNYAPLIKKKFDERKKEAREWKMVSYGVNGVEMKKGRMCYIVKLDRRTCSCRYWQISGIPCCHAICAIWRTGAGGGDPDKFLDPCYSSKETSSSKGPQASKGPAVIKAKTDANVNASATSKEDKLKGKRKITVSEVKYKKKSTKGMGLYTKKDGTSTFYNAFDFGNSSKEPAARTKRGRSSNADPVGTQESVKKKK
ncbi:Zinc finger, PMZ-type [Corchorus olitorius]|uniref:Zinc finger, PMZ-type n=1 Tax=Corchorus olitorius TaxID=93759 RepID=A0A1R3GHQ8_9ROSI|nr:Zinc finger, PMZ-type [Corchorus olitorius]